MIGSCGLHRRNGGGGLDLGYWLHPAWTGKGLATMAAAALVDQGLRLGNVDRIEIHHDAANSASGAVARRSGFTEAERRPSPEGPPAPGEVGVDVVLADDRGSVAGADAKTGAPTGLNRRPTSARRTSYYGSTLCAVASLPDVPLRQKGSLSAVDLFSSETAAGLPYFWRWLDATGTAREEGIGRRTMSPLHKSHQRW